MNNKDNDKEMFNKLISNSITGGNSINKASGNFSMKKEKLVKSTTAICLTCCIIGSLSTVGLSKLVKNIHDYSLTNENVLEFKKEVIAPNTYRTEDFKGCFYDYEAISKKIETDLDIYYLYRNFGLDNTNEVLRYIKAYESVDDFLRKHNFKDTNEWKKTVVRQVALEEEIESKVNEYNSLNKDLLDEFKNQDNKTVGGK